MSIVHWTEKYRPKTVDECILPERYKETFKNYVSQGFIPDTILAGTPGIGKTTVAMAMLDELDLEYIKLNTSLFGGIDTLRDKITNFATTMSFRGERKYVILDEADRMSQAFQEGLRAFLDQYQANCGFILTCNYPSKIIDPIQSRCILEEIKIEKSDFQTTAREFFLRLCKILEYEGVNYNKVVVAEVIKKVFPDFRKAIALLQKYALSRDNKIDVGVLSISTNEKYTKLIGIMKEKKWIEMRDWVGENFAYIGDFSTFGSEFYKASSNLLTSNCLPIFVELLNQFDYQDAFVTDKELNLAAFLTRFMADATWK